MTLSAPASDGAGGGGGQHRRALLAWAAGWAGMGAVPQAVGRAAAAGSGAATEPGAGTPPAGRVWRVGPGRALRRIAEAAEAAGDGDLVEIDAGDYLADTALWRQRRITVRGVGGRVRLLAGGASAEGKAIWVVRCDRMDAEGLDFQGARVPDRNGAGIRHERGRLLLRDCRFIDNENGILTGNDPQAELDLVGCEFGHNGAGDGRSHNLYAGRIARLRALGCHFHHARVGHLLKSRAAVHEILACVLDDGTDGRASYELEFPEGGDATVAVNLIAQSPRTENPALLSFAAEGARGDRHRLLLLHNTLVDRRPAGGRFIDLHRMAPAGVLQAWNNLRAGPGRWPVDVAGPAQGNLAATMVAFRSVASGDFRLRNPPPAAWRAAPLPDGMPAPAYEIARPGVHRPAAGPPRWVGALAPTDAREGVKG